MKVTKDKGRDWRRDDMTWRRDVTTWRDNDDMHACTQTTFACTCTHARACVRMHATCTQTTFLVTQLACPMRHAHDDMHANYFSRHSTSPNHRACIPLLDSRRLRTRECFRSHCQKYTTPLISFFDPMLRVTYIANFLTQGANGSNPKKRFFQKRLNQFLRNVATL